jgi:hypothetical protein
MPHSVYTSLKGVAYATLATIASCDHNKAKAAGYTDGWQMLLDKHDGAEMVAFCGALPRVLSEEQCKVLLDGLAEEYTQFKRWPEFADACAEHPEWLPSKGPLPT